MKRIRLSMKLLWKLHAKWLKEVWKEDGSQAFATTEDYITFVESEMKKNPLTIKI